MQVLTTLHLSQTWNAFSKNKTVKDAMDNYFFLFSFLLIPTQGYAASFWFFGEQIKANFIFFRQD